LHLNLSFHLQLSMKYMVLFSLLLSYGSIRAQDLKLAGVEYLSYPKVQMKGDAQGNQASFQEFGAYVNYPVVSKNKKTIVVNGFQYGLVRATAYNNTLNTATSNDLQGIAYNIMVIRRWNEKWTFIGRLSPTLISDFSDKLSSSDVAFQASVLAVKKIKEGLSAGGGLIFTTRLGSPLLIPCLQLKYKQNRSAFDIMLPAFISYTYQVDAKERLKVGLRVAINGANFNIGLYNFSKGTAMDRLNYSRTNLGPTISYQLAKMLQV
jgi:hypothetical protein